MNPAMNQTHLRVGALAEQIGRELSVLAGEVDELQSMLSDILCASAPDPNLILQAQALDRTFQNITQLGGVLERIARQADPDWQIEAPSLLAPVSLTALARRLAGQGAADVEVGDLELW